MPGLIDKLGDNKVAVRQANGKLLAVLMSVLQPATVLDALSPALMHGNWKVREAAVNIFIQVWGVLQPAPTLYVNTVCCTVHDNRLYIVHYISKSLLGPPRTNRPKTGVIFCISL